MRYKLSFILALISSLALAGLRSGAYAQASPAPAAPAAAAPSAPVTADGEASGTQVQVKALKRVGGDSLMLELVIINSSDTAYDPNNLQSSTYRSDDGIYLVDMTGKKKYEVVRDTDGNCLCSKNLESIAGKSSLNIWAKFPAPPDTVQKIGIVVPHFMPMDDVPISSQ
ncbi:MAG: hypothetical protein ACLPKT_17750 [Methylocella sp.]